LHNFSFQFEGLPDILFLDSEPVAKKYFDEEKTAISKRIFFAGAGF